MLCFRTTALSRKSRSPYCNGSALLLLDSWRDPSSRFVAVLIVMEVLSYTVGEGDLADNQGITGVLYYRL